MKKIIYILLLLLVGAVAEAAPKVKDPIVMTVGGIKVTRSEFEAFYRKNSQMTEGEPLTFDKYVEMYVAYKLKVAEALSQHIDTTKAFKDEFETYRRQLVESMRDQNYWKDSLVNEIVARIPYEVHAAHILKLVDENAPDSLVEAKRAMIESFKHQIEAGAPFDSIASAESDDPSGRRAGGDLGYFRMLQMVYPFEDAAYTTPIGEMTVCRSQYGIHLIKVIDRRKMDLDRINPQIVKMIEEGKAEEPLLGQLKALVENDKDRAAKGLELMEARYPESEIVANPEYQALYREYYDGILLFDVANDAVWGKAATDSVGQSEYFEAHRGNYKFDATRWKGAFIECADDSLLVARLTEIYQNNDYLAAADVVRNTVLTDSILTPNPRQPRFHIINGLFKSIDYPVRDDMPKQMTFVRELSEPDSIDDVRGKVIADYQDELEKQFVARLKNRHKVKLNKKELAKIEQAL